MIKKELASRDDNFNVLREKFHRSRYAKVNRLIGGRKTELLDIGCGKPCDSMGDGSFIEYIGYGTGLDLRLCRLKGSHVNGDVLNLPFKKNSFDVVVAMEVLEHVDDVEHAITGISAIMKENAVF
ncbi:MAG: class I SAM-dependent methyltransferase, partial [Candidatus Altiarchaeota archaeon]